MLKNAKMILDPNPDPNQPQNHFSLARSRSPFHLILFKSAVNFSRDHLHRQTDTQI